jgi:hypothetical protein
MLLLVASLVGSLTREPHTVSVPAQHSISNETVTVTIHVSGGGSDYTSETTHRITHKVRAAAGMDQCAGAAPCADSRTTTAEARARSCPKVMICSYIIVSLHLGSGKDESGRFKTTVAAAAITSAIGTAAKVRPTLEMAAP